MVGGKTVRDCISNEPIRDMTGMEKTNEFCRESRNYDGLGIWKGWFGESYSESINILYLMAQKKADLRIN